MTPGLYDAILRQTPLNILLFDASLVCRYAAPVGETLLGSLPTALLGRTADEVLPPAANGLRPVLERAATGHEAWQDDAYRFTLTNEQGEASPCCWSIQVEPVRAAAYHGVLVTWRDVCTLVAERDALAADVHRLAEADAERRRLITAVLTEVRSLIAPASGYLQVIARRPWLLARVGISAVVNERVLPGLDRAVSALERLRPLTVRPERGPL